MKKVEAFIRHEAFEPIRMELLSLGFPSLSIMEVKGSGRQKGITERYRGAELTNYLRPKVKIECVVATPRRADGRRHHPQARAHRLDRRRQGVRPARGGGVPHPHGRVGRGDAAGASRRGGAVPQRGALGTTWPPLSPYPPRVAPRSSSGCAPCISRWSTRCSAATASAASPSSPPARPAAPSPSSSRGWAPRSPRRARGPTSASCAATSPTASPARVRAAPCPSRAPPRRRPAGPCGSRAGSRPRCRSARATR